VPAVDLIDTGQNGDRPEFRESMIDFGDSGYVALYRHKPTADAVYVLAFRHQEEAGY